MYRTTDIGGSIPLFHIRFFSVVAWWR